MSLYELRGDANRLREQDVIVEDKRYQELDETDPEKLKQKFGEVIEEFLNGKSSLTLAYSDATVNYRWGGNSDSSNSLLHSKDWPELLPGTLTGEVRFARNENGSYFVSVKDWMQRGIDFSLINGTPKVGHSVSVDGDPWIKKIPVKDPRLESDVDKLRYGLFVLLRVKNARLPKSWQSKAAA